MDKLELDELLKEIRELQHSVRRANPFLREIMALRIYAILSLPFGILLLADCLVTHFLILGYGSFSAIPAGWKIASLALFILIGTVGSATKWIAVARRAAQVREGANFFSVIAAMYGGHWFNLSGPLVLGMIVSSIYFIASGHPWLVVSTVAIFIGPFCNIVAKLLERREYLFTGWYLTVTGLASLFFVESLPLVWLAIVWAGTFLVFGAVGLAANRSEEKP